jgi:hypothetical protein
VKRVLLDHCVPRRVSAALSRCEVKTAFQEGWATLKNGALLRATEDAGFDVLVTCDKKLWYQQNIPKLRIAIVILPTNALERLLPIFPEIATAVTDAPPGGFVEISAVP